MGIDDGDGLGIPKKKSKAKNQENRVLKELSDSQLMVIYLDVRKSLNKIIDKEIEARKGEVQFMASEYRKHRLNGLKPEEIHYDLCHPCR